MSSYLRVYDFNLTHKSNSTNTNCFEFAFSSPEITTHIPAKSSDSRTIQRKVVLDAYLKKFVSDLAGEILKNNKTKKIVKKSRFKQGRSLKERPILKDEINKNIYGILNGGRITEQAILEKRSQNVSNTAEPYDYEELNGERIYDDFFFFLHLSFECNVARLFVLTRRSNVNVDAVLKKYFKDNMFKSKKYARTKVSDFISAVYRDEVINRSIVKNILISKNDRIVSETDGETYSVEIRLKPKSDRPFINITGPLVDKFRRSKVIVDEDESDDENSSVKFSIKDPETGKTKTIAFGGESDFSPSLVIPDEDILDETNRLDVDKLKAICEEYIVYEQNILQ